MSITRFAARPRGGYSVPLPQWVPEPDNVAVLSVANGRLLNNFRATVAPNYDAFYAVATVNDYSGSVVNPYYGPYGAIIFDGAGHASSTNTNAVVALELGYASAGFRRVTTPSNLFALNGIPNEGANQNQPVSADWGEYDDGTPAGRHSYADFAVIGPHEGGAAHGTLYSIQPSSLGNGGALLPRHAAHRLDFDNITGILTRSRAGTIDPVSYGARAVVFSEHVPAQQRIYAEATGSGHKPRWYDLASGGDYVVGTGTALTDDGSGDGGALFHVPSRGLLIACNVNSGNLRLRYMDVSASDPSWVNAPRTLSASIPIATNWSAACWCPHSDRILIGNISGDDQAVYEIEIPGAPGDTWPCTRRPFAGTIAWTSPGDSGNTYKKWSYNALTRSIVILPNAQRSPANDEVYVYRPHGT